MLPDGLAADFGGLRGDIQPPLAAGEAECQRDGAGLEQGDGVWDGMDKNHRILLQLQYTACCYSLLYSITPRHSLCNAKWEAHFEPPKQAPK